MRSPATQPLALPAVADKSTATGTVVNEQLPEATEGLTPYIYSASGLPPGLGFRNRRVQGIPVLPGAYTVSYVVTDSNQDMVERTFTWTITGSPIPQPTGLNMRIDWGAQFYANAHSNITDRITSGIDFERGRNTASAILGRSQAGILRCELQNDDGLYDEENPDSALAGLVRPGLQVQLRNGVTPLWTGVLDSIPTQYALNGQHRAQLTAYGVLSNAVDPDVSGGSLNAESTAQAFIELCTKGDVPYESPQPQPGDAYVMRRWWLIGKLRRNLNSLEDTEGGFVFEDREGEVGFHLANYRGLRTVGKTFVSTTPGANEIRIVGNPRRINAVKDVHNVVAGSVRQFESKADETVFASLDPIPIALGGRLDLVSVYDVARGAVSELNALIAGTDWTANTSPDGSGNNRTSQVDIEIELMDFNETHMTLTYPTITGQTQADTVYVRGLTVMGTVLAEGTPLLVTREDTVSKERYRPKTHRLRNTWIRSPADMESRADAILDVIASPERRVSLDWYITDWNEFTSLDLSDKVRIELPTISSDGFIEAVAVQIPLAQNLIVCTLDVSLVEGVATPVVPPAPMAAWDQFKALTGALGIQFEAGVNFVDLYENDPAGEGVLTDSTTGQFTDNTIFWVERVRWVTGTDSFQIHRGGSTVNAGTYLGGLADEWTLYILDEDDDQYIAIRANSLGNNTSQNGKWDEATWEEVSSHYVSNYNSFISGLPGSNLIVGLANDDAWVPYS